MAKNISFLVVLSFWVGLNCKENAHNSYSQTEYFNNFFQRFCEDTLFREARTIKPFPYMVLIDVEASEDDISNYKIEQMNQFPFKNMKISEMEHGTMFSFDSMSINSMRLKIQIEDTGVQYWIQFNRKSVLDNWNAIWLKDVST